MGLELSGTISLEEDLHGSVNIPVLKGDKGDKGDPGIDGHSPVVTATKSGGVVSIMVDGTEIATVADGVDGHSPVVTATKSGGVTTISVDGTAIATVNDGIDGRNGQDGQDGHSPVVTASKSGKTTTISVDGTPIATITDGSDGQDGEDGHSPVVTASKSGKVTTISVDGTAIATITDGEDGADGQDGHSPVITATKSGGVTTISVDGTAIATVSDGTDGTDGQDGHSPVITGSKSGTVTTISADGTPIATINDGDDYVLTPSDKAEIAALVDVPVSDVTINGTSVVSSDGVAEIPLATKAPVIIDTASGTIASFDDGADDMPLKSLTVSIEPVQDLHGYENPWPAGGGKNLIAPTLFNNQSQIQSNGVTLSVEGQKFKLLGTATASGGRTTLRGNAFTLVAGDYTLSRSQSIGAVSINKTTDDSAIRIIVDSVLSSTFTLSEDTSVYIGFGVASGTTYNEVIAVQLEAGSTETAWTPYSNICPITGWTEANVTRTGFNVWNEEWEVGDYDGSGQKRVNNSRIRCKNLIHVLSNTTYYFMMETTSGIMWCFYDNSGAFISSASRAVGQGGFTIITPENCHFLTFGTWDAYGSTYKNDICINISDPAKNGTYEPGHVVTIPITFPTEAGTVYGGTLDVTTGLLTVDRAYFDLSTIESWSSDAPSTAGYIRFIRVITDKAFGMYLCCDALPVKQSAIIGDPTSEGISGYNSKNTVYLSIDASRLSGDLSTAAGRNIAFKSYLAVNPINIVYELATPQTYQLAPTEVDTLLGENNIWADTGDSAVTYIADTKTYVDDHTPVQDVQVNGTSVVSGGVAEIPVASEQSEGVVKTSEENGITIDQSNNRLAISRAVSGQIKNGINHRKPIVCTNQHEATFYGLAKAAGADEKNSTLAVGTYTDTAKAAIKNMLGVSGESQTITVTGTTPVITAQANTRYICGEVLSLDFTPCATGICNVMFTSGSTVTVLNLPQTVKMPEWFEVETNTTYEISIMDGVYGAVISWGA